VTDASSICKSCGLAFTVSDDELAALHAIAARAGWHRAFMPQRCVACRFADRADRYPSTPVSVADGPVDLTCVDCSRVFVFGQDEGERRYFASRGYTRPKRCESCRRARRDARA
jgi:hypothetical protein